MPYRLPHLLVMATMATGPAIAEPGQMVGTWCGEDGTVLYVNWTQLGANEHTICTPARPLRRDQRAWVSPLSCHNLYITGQDASGNAQIEQVPVPDVKGIAARLTTDDTLTIRIKGTPPRTETLVRCLG